jgi:hypothetical protein
MKHTVVSLAGGKVECLEGNNRVVTHSIAVVEKKIKTIMALI